jgi:hypothetical protein
MAHGFVRTWPRDKQTIPRKKQQTGTDRPPPPLSSVHSSSREADKARRCRFRYGSQCLPCPPSSRASTRRRSSTCRVAPPGSGGHVARSLRSGRNPAFRADVFTLPPDWRLPFPPLFLLFFFFWWGWNLRWSLAVARCKRRALSLLASNPGSCSISVLVLACEWQGLRVRCGNSS